MRLLALAIAASLYVALAPTGATAGSPAPASKSIIAGTIGLDHLLLWSRDQRAAEDYLHNDLGFEVPPTAGSYGAGISNKIIRFDNRGFIEFLWLSDPETAKKDAFTEYTFAEQRGGSDAFGMQVTDVDRAHAFLSEAGLAPDDPTAEAYDPDGSEGPKQPIVNQWRFMFLQEGSLAGNPFFVEYKASNTVQPAQPAHSNGATRLSTVWLLVKDVDRVAAAYRKASFPRRRSVSIPPLGLSGVSFGAGSGEIWLLTPRKKNGALYDRLEKYGDQIIGASFRVRDIGATRRLLQGKTSRRLLEYRGLRGAAIVVPSLERLGLLIAFEH